MSKIFISHSTRNKNLVEKWIEFMQIGMGVSREDIFCSSLCGAISTGEDFNDVIRCHLKESEYVIALVTSEYLDSKFCIMELGAAWVMDNTICLLLADGIEHSQLNDMPLRNLQMRYIEREEDIFAMYSELSTKNIISNTNLGELNKKLPSFMEYIKGQSRNGIVPDQDGFYHCIVEKERMVPAPYRCYKIKGNLLLPGIDTKDETHWLFFKAGVYDNLRAGMRVKIKVHSTECKDFSDIESPRNIYPDYLTVEN